MLRALLYAGVSLVLLVGAMLYFNQVLLNQQKEAELRQMEQQIRQLEYKLVEDERERQIQAYIDAERERKRSMDEYLQKISESDRYKLEVDIPDVTKYGITRDDLRERYLDQHLDSIDRSLQGIYNSIRFQSW